MEANSGKPPVFGSWKGWYIFVALMLAVTIAVLAILTRMYEHY